LYIHFKETSNEIIIIIRPLNTLDVLETVNNEIKLYKALSLM